MSFSKDQLIIALGIKADQFRTKRNELILNPKYTEKSKTETIKIIGHLRWIIAEIQFQEGLLKRKLPIPPEELQGNFDETIINDLLKNTDLTQDSLILTNENTIKNFHYIPNIIEDLVNQYNSDLMEIFGPTNTNLELLASWWRGEDLVYSKLSL